MRLLSLLVLAACAGAQAAPATQQTTPEATAEVVDPFALPPGAEERAAQVELVTAGTAGEAALIRLHPEEGYTQRMSMSMTMSMAMNMGQPMPEVVMPTSHMVFAMRVTNVDDNGLTRREILLEEVRVDPGAHAAAMEAELLPLQGLTGVEIVDARGRTLYLSYDIPENVSDATRASMERMQDVMKQVQPPFPAEPVAVGARWRVESEIRSNVVMQQVQDYELLEREGDRIVLQITTTQTAQPQPMEVPQPGMSARLLSLTGEGSGRSEINLAQLATNASADVRVELHSEIMPDGQPVVPMSMLTEVHLQTAPR